MSNSAMPNLPGFGAIAESMELVRKMWGGAGTPGIGFPGMTTPTLSVEEIDKQIADLKAVEAWLTLNMNMLRGTIQALEVQSATISALKSMGEAFKNAGKATTAAKPAAGFAFPFAYPAQPQASPQPQSSQASAGQPPQPNSAAQPAYPDINASLADPAAWWNMLQGQFKQAITAATAQTGAGENSSVAGGTSGDTPGASEPNQEVGGQHRTESRSSAPAADTAEAADSASQSNTPTKRMPKATGKPPSA